MQPSGHSSGAPAMSGAALVYLILEVVWTSLLLLLVFKNFRNRDSYAVKIRGWNLMVAQVAALHVYVSAIFIVYPLNGAYSCTSEFWMMNIIFPGGLALFQASTVKLLAVHENQLALFHAECPQDMHYTVGRVKVPYFPWVTVKAQDLKLVVHYSWISLAFSIQAIATAFLFLGSRRFGVSTAFFGESADFSDCRRGWEWVPSVFWQFFFTWIYAPYLLAKSWHIQDIYKWSLQTALCVLFGMPGTPLWLATLYGPQDKLQWFYRYMPPATWFAPGLMAMELTTLLMPLVCNDHSSSFQQARENLVAAYATLASGKQKDKDETTFKVRACIINNRAAMDYQLEDHPGNTPFARFCAQKAFVYHSVLFVRGTQSFKRTFSFGSDVEQQFEQAAYLWFVLGDLDTSPFGGVNVPWTFTRFMRGLFQDITFEPAEPYIVNNAAPWEDIQPPGYNANPGSMIALNNVADPESLPQYAQFDLRGFGALKRSEDFIVPSSFLPSVFDAIREHIMDTFFKGPWRNYVINTASDEFLKWPLDRFVPRDEDHPARTATV